jgi:hypothetical protein
MPAAKGGWTSRIGPEKTGKPNRERPSKSLFLGNSRFAGFKWLGHKHRATGRFVHLNESVPVRRQHGRPSAVREGAGLASLRPERRRLQVKRQHRQSEFIAQRFARVSDFVEAGLSRPRRKPATEPNTNRNKLEKGRSHEIQIEIPDFADAVCFGMRGSICAG